MEPTWKNENGTVRLFLGDCRDVLSSLSIVDAIVTDPPYGILNVFGDTTAIRKSRRKADKGFFKGRSVNRTDVEWDVAPDESLFNLLFMKSKEQIIWGLNYFPLPPTRGIL